MMKHARVAWTCVLALGACGPAVVPAGTGESSTGAGDAHTTGSEGTLEPTPTTAADGADTSSGSTTAEASGDTAPTCAAQPLGSPCEDACDCESDHCFVVEPFEGMCSECNEDSDCPRDTICLPANPITRTPATCIGEGPPLPRGTCETDASCPEGQYCTTLYHVDGILEAAFCSECEVGMGCSADQLCVPTYDVDDLTGQFSCVDPGTVPEGAGCNVDGDGSECASGQCAPVSLKGMPFIAVCATCNDDADCGGTACQLPELAIMGNALELLPGGCT